MKISGNTVLITGGATGIGFALAEKFLENDNDVIICGRRKQKLKEAKDKLHKIHTLECDISRGISRDALFKDVKQNFKNINILVNNAGIQRTIDFKKGISIILNGEDEIATNLVAPIFLSAYFIPELMKKESAIINVSSGLSFVPIAFMPIYCATKAGLHSFSISLRHQLKDTSIKVFEVIPPKVDTELYKVEERQTDRGIPASDVASAVLNGIETNEYEIVIGMAQELKLGNSEDIFKRINR